jgi:hypothetical protein
VRVFLGLGLGLYVSATTLACATTRTMFVPPAGPGTPVAYAAAALTEATATCRVARSYTAAARASGKFGAERLWPVGIDIAVTTDQSIYLSANAVGRSLFVLAGTGNRATLWLRQDERVVTAAPAEIMDAIVGVSIAPDRLLAVLTGCVARSLNMTGSALHGDLLAVETADARLYLQQKDGRWRTRAATTDAFVVEFAAYQGPVPSDVWIWSIAGREPAANVRFAISDWEIDGQIPAGVFQVPRGAVGAKPLTLDELRAAGPWKERGGTSEK